jgi:hypothetical protein
MQEHDSLKKIFKEPDYGATEVESLKGRGRILATSQIFSSRYITTLLQVKHPPLYTYYATICPKRAADK